MDTLLDAPSSKLTMAERLQMWRAAKEISTSTKQNRITTPTNSIAVSKLFMSSPVAGNQIKKQCQNTNSGSKENKSNNTLSESDSSSCNDEETVGKSDTKRNSIFVLKGSKLFDCANESSCNTSSPLRDTNSTDKKMIQKKKQSYSPLSSSNKYNLSASPIRAWFGRQNQIDACNYNCHLSSPTTSINNSGVDELDGYMTAFDDSRQSIGSERSSICSSNGSPLIRVNKSMQNGNCDKFRNQKVSIGSSNGNHSTSLLKIAIQHAHQEIEELQAQVMTLSERNRTLEEKLSNSSANAVELQTRADMAIEEVDAMVFLNEVQEQKIGELEDTISRDRMDQNEAISSKARKHKSEIKKLIQEKNEYEERANQMTQQLTEQMSLLQTMAMGRIEELEKDLLDERRKYEQLETETNMLRRNAAMKLSRQIDAIECLTKNETDDENDDDGNVTETSTISDCDVSI